MKPKEFAETDTLICWWPADCLYQLLPLCLASPSHSQLVWGITLQKKEADWFDSPLGNKTSLQPRKHDLQRMTEGTRLFSLAKTEDRHDNYLWNTWQVSGKKWITCSPYPRQIGEGETRPKWQWWRFRSQVRKSLPVGNDSITLEVITWWGYGVPICESFQDQAIETLIETHKTSWSCLMAENWARWPLEDYFMPYCHLLNY